MELEVLEPPIEGSALRGSMFVVRKRRNIRIIYSGPLNGKSRTELKQDEADTLNPQRVGPRNVIDIIEHTTEGPE